MEAAIRAELGDELYDRLQGSMLIYSNATVHLGEEVTTYTIDGVQVHFDIDGLSEEGAAALSARIETAITNSDELTDILAAVARHAPEGEDARVRLTTPIDFSGPANLSERSIRLPPQGNFVPVVGNLSVHGQSQERVSYQRTYTGVMIAPPNHPGLPQFGESSGGVEVGGETYYPVPFVEGSVYHANCGFVLYAPVSLTSSPDEFMKSLGFTDRGRRGDHMEFYPPDSVVMQGSAP